MRKLFPREEINGGGRCPTYLYRYILFSCRWFKVYLHHFVADGWSLDFHDHPKRFLSIGLWGRYIEEMPCRLHGAECWPAFNREHRYRAPWIRTFPANHIHRLRLIDGKPCWTLVVVFKTVREWGFWHAGEWIQWRKYVGSEIADKMKACD